MEEYNDFMENHSHQIVGKTSEGNKNKDARPPLYKEYNDEEIMKFYTDC